MQKNLKLIVEDVDIDSFEYLVEEKNSSSEPKYYIKGAYIMLNEKNQNGRIYSDEEMQPCVEQYIEKYVKTNRALNELNHPERADVDLERACDMTVSLVKEGNYYIGKSLCLSTPLGMIQKQLLMDGVRIGKSTRCLGQLTESNGINYVKSPKLICCDSVWEPSGQGKDNSCFVNGILENKEFIINYNGNNEIIYDGFEKSIDNLPSKKVNEYLTEQILKFIHSVK